jgi:hypothetical protein
MNQFTLGDAITFTATFANSAGAAFDPTSTWGTVWDANSVAVNSFSALTNAGVGSYIATWQSNTPAALGRLSFEAFGLSGSLVYRRRAVVAELV